MKEFLNVISYIGGLAVGLTLLALALSGIFATAMAIVVRRQGLTLDDVRERAERDYRDID